MSDSFHTIVIGAGSGGLTVAVGLANLGKPVAVIEALHVGGDCTNVRKNAVSFGGYPTVTRSVSNLTVR